jgi:hypothetical protein
LIDSGILRFWADRPAKKPAEIRRTDLYEIELTNSKHLENAVRFEIAVSGDGEAELRELQNDD